jgi:GT2 family glycosyltransferase
MIDVLIINLNCLDHTKNIINDLRKQTYKNFDLTVLDQGSKEEGTKEYLNELKGDKELTPIVVRHEYNIPINVLWNNHVEISVHPIICILNNDIRIPSNFMKDV